MLEFQSVVDTSSTFISEKEVQKNIHITKLVGFKECKYTTKDGGKSKGHQHVSVLKGGKGVEKQKF